MKNLFEADAPDDSERFERVLARRNVVIERIVSAAYTDGEVYQQPQDEWVALLAGSAELELEGADGRAVIDARDAEGARRVALGPGSHVYIPANTRHRVRSCSGDAIWLAVHIHPTRPAAPCAIEAATPARIAALCARVPELSSTSAEAIEARIAGRRSLAEVAVVDGEDAGFKVGYADTPSRFYSWLGGVVPEHRKGGVARALLESQHAWCASEGFETIEVKTYNRYRGMLKLLIASGYEVFGVQANGAIVLRAPSSATRPAP